MRDEISNLIQGIVNKRLGAAATLDPQSIIPAVNHGSVEDMLADVFTRSSVSICLICGYSPGDI